MADFLSDYKKREIEWKLKLSADFPLEYAKQQIAQEYDFICCVQIPWPLLIQWCDLDKVTSGEDVNFIDLLNATVVDGWFCLKRSNTRLNELIRKKAQTVRAMHKRTAGRKRKELDTKVYSLCVRRGELESIQALKSETMRINKELDEWRKSYTDLENEKKKLYEEMRQEITKLEDNVTNLSEVNKELLDYIEALETEEAAQTCTGKKFLQVGPKQRGRKLWPKIQFALWFSESFGLKLSQVKLSDDKGGTHLLTWENESFETLQEEDNNKLEQILFLLDKFCVGDEVYHERTIHTDDLPKSYLIKQLRSNLNKTYHIERTQGKFPGAAINFTTTLKQHIKQLLNDKPELQDTAIEVKISGDGARMSRTTNFMMFSFALLQAKESVMSSKSNRTVAIVNGPEKYDTMKTSLNFFFQEVNELIDKQTISIDGKEIKLKFFLGGDMKFLLMIMGLNSATADYACLWCKIFKEDRWDTSKPSDYYNKEPLKRDLQEIKTLSL